MKEKIISAVLALTMAFASAPMTFAASPLKTVIDSYLAGLGLANSDTVREVEVPTDISLKKDGETSYVNGPLQLYIGEAKATSFDFKADIDMTDVVAAVGFYDNLAAAMVAAEPAANQPALQNDVDNSYVVGQFVIEIEYPATGVKIPDAVVSATGMDGFSSAKDYTQVFEETVSRTNVGNKLTITVDVKSGVKLQTLKNYLDNLEFKCDGIEITEAGTYSITGKVSGWTEIMAPDTTTMIGKLKYNFNQKPDDTESGLVYVDPQNSSAISGTVIVNAGGTGGSSLGTTKKTLTVIISEDIDPIAKTYSSGATVVTKEIDIPSRPGYKLEGLYKDPELTQPLEDEFKITTNMTVYTKWTEEETVSPFDSDEHYAYIIGYPTEDGSDIVKPEANITREEITTIYYRMLKDEIRYDLFTALNDFSDVEEDRWSNKAISTMANGGYVKGYEDGSFGPARSTTRAEFVTIAARFYNVDADSLVVKSELTDIDGHWAEAYINYAVTKGWINGYEDGSFRPDDYITRAEVMKIVNSMLNRHIDEEGLVEDAIRWDDNPSDKWYYYDVIEATNPHIYNRAEGETYEDWSEITENKVWTDKPVYEDAE